MSPVDVCGVFSTFGEQIRSEKRTEPVINIGKGKRGAKTYEKGLEVVFQGLESPGANYRQEVCSDAQQFVESVEEFVRVLGPIRCCRPPTLRLDDCKGSLKIPDVNQKHLKL